MLVNPSKDRVYKNSNEQSLYSWSHRLWAHRGIGLSEMLYCIENKKKHRCSGELSLHVLDIIDSTMQAAISKTHKEMRTTCKKPEFFPEEEIKKNI